MIKCLCASLLLAATSSLPAVSFPDYYTPAVSDVDLTVEIDDVSYQRIFYNEEAYLEFADSISYANFCVGPDNYFYLQYSDSGDFMVNGTGLVYDSSYGSFLYDWSCLYFIIDNSVITLDDNTAVTGFCFSYWYLDAEFDFIYYTEFYRDDSSAWWSTFALNIADSSNLVLDDWIDEPFSALVSADDVLHFDPLPSAYYDFLVEQEEVLNHPLLPRTQPKLKPDSVTDKDFNLWNTVRDFYVRYLFGGTDSAGTVFNKVSFGSVPTTSFNVDVGDNSVSMGDWLSSTLTIITFALFVFVIVLVIRWIAVSLGNAIMGVSGR